jgi:TolA-binding protein
MNRLAHHSLLICLAAAPAAAFAQDADLAAKKLAAATGLYQRHLYKLAAEQYADFLKENPNHADARAARLALGVCWFRIGEHEKSAAILSELAADPAFAQADEALLVAGHAQLARKEYAKGIAAFDQILAKFPKSASAESAALNRAQALYLAGRFKESAEACAAFAKDRPQSLQRGEALYFQALSQRALNQPDPAIATLRELIEAYAKSDRAFDASLLLSQIHEQAGRIDAAAEALRRLGTTSADRKAEAHYALSLLFYRAGRYDDSAGTIKVILSQFPDDPVAKSARLQLGLTYVAARKYDDARGALAEVVKNDPSRAIAARYWLAQCDIGQKNFPAARTALLELASIQPPAANLEQIVLDLADCLMGQGKFADAAGEYEAFVNRFSNTTRAADAIYRQAFCLHRDGKYEKSLEIARKAKPAAGAPAAQVEQLIAEDLFMLARYAEASAAFAIAEKSAVDRALRLRLAVRRGQCEYFNANYEEAVAVFSPAVKENAVRNDPELSRALLVMGDALLQLNRNAEAAAALADFLSIAQKD